MACVNRGSTRWTTNILRRPELLVSTHSPIENCCRYFFARGNPHELLVARRCHRFHACGDSAGRGLSGLHRHAANGQRRGSRWCYRCFDRWTYRGSDWGRRWSGRGVRDRRPQLVVANAGPDDFPTTVCSSSCSPAACPPCHLVQDHQGPLPDGSLARQDYLVHQVRHTHAVSLDRPARPAHLDLQVLPENQGHRVRHAYGVCLDHLVRLPWKPGPAHLDLQVLPENQGHRVRHAYGVCLDHLVRLPWKPGPAHRDLHVLPENQGHLVRHAYGVCLDHLVRLPWKPGPAHWDLQVLPENQGHLVRHAYGVCLDHLVRLPWKPDPAHWDLQVLPENQGHLVRHAYAVSLDHLVRLP